MSLYCSNLSNVSVDCALFHGEFNSTVSTRHFPEEVKEKRKVLQYLHFDNQTIEAD